MTKRTKTSVASPGLLRPLFSMPGLLSLISCFATACALDLADEGDVADEGEETGTEVQALGGGDTANEVETQGAGCPLRHPMGWTVSGVACAESPNVTQPTWLNDGQAVTAIGVPHCCLLGEGWTRWRCVDGELVTEVEVCRPSRGDPF